MVQADHVNGMFNTMGNFSSPSSRIIPWKNVNELAFVRESIIQHVNLKTFSSISYLLEALLFSIINAIIIVMSVLLGDGYSQMPNFYYLYIWHAGWWAFEMKTWRTSTEVMEMLHAYGDLKFIKNQCSNGLIGG